MANICVPQMFLEEVLVSSECSVKTICVVLDQYPE